MPKTTIDNGYYIYYLSCSKNPYREDCTTVPPPVPRCCLPYWYAFFSVIDNSFHFFIH